MRTRLVSAAVASAILPLALAAQGPTGTYYLTAGDQRTNWRVQGATATSSAQQNFVGNFGESAVAVAGDVRTMGEAAAGNVVGSQYNLAFVYTGTNYGTPCGACYDGTTDGTYNYSVNYGGGVYRFGRDWTSQTLLFTPALAGALGVTYDPTNNSLWVSAFSGTTVANYSLTGTLLGSFNAAFTGIGALAMDYTDGTLWMGSQNTLGTFYQYSRAGVLLQSVTYANMQAIPGAGPGQNTLGGEFNFVPTATTTPEPATLALLGGGLALIGAAARRRRRTDA